MTAEKDLGKRIRQVRTSKQISIEQLAEKTGIDEIVLQRVENEKFVPSLATMIRISHSLGVRLGTFLDDNEQLGPSVTRDGELDKGIRVVTRGSQFAGNLNFYSLAPNKAGRSMEPFVINILPDHSDESLFSSHEGEEFIYVLEGRVEIVYGKERFQLHPGDSIYLDSVIDHKIHSGNDLPAKVLAVMYTPF